MTRKLAAFAFGRRTVAAAVFSGEQLEYTQARQLSSESGKAEESAVGFANWIAQKFEVTSAAVLQPNLLTNSRRAALYRAVVAALRRNATPLWAVTKADLLRGLGIVPLSSLGELHESVVAIWPVLSQRSLNHLCLDAVGVGLHVQLERLFAD
ncbi:MAG: hypothetical protein ABFD89_29850 [Bryobacteraceae bacterium]